MANREMNCHEIEPLAAPPLTSYHEIEPPAAPHLTYYYITVIAACNYEMKPLSTGKKIMYVFDDSENDPAGGGKF